MDQRLMTYLKNKAILALLALLGTGVFIGVGAPQTDEQRIADFQERYFEKHGEYFQLLPDQKLPSDATENMKAYGRDNLTMPLNGNYRVDVAEHPDGTWEYTITEIIEEETTATST